MKLTQMQYFAAVCEHNNITKAAKQLRVSQPAISAAIRELETEFGIKLFNRMNNRLTLTPEGKFFLNRCQSILRESTELELKMKDLGRKHNRIRIGVPPMIGVFLFTEIFNKFKSFSPETTLEVIEAGSLEIRNYVLENQVDIAIGVLDNRMSSQITTEQIIRTDLVFCVSKQHPLAGTKSATFEMLKHEKLILMKADSYQNPTIKEKFHQMGVEPNVLLYSNQFHTIRQFLNYGNCGAFVFREIADMDDNLVAISLSSPIPISIGLIWRSHSPLYSDTERFIRFIRKEFTTTNKGQL